MSALFTTAAPIPCPPAPQIIRLGRSSTKSIRLGPSESAHLRVLSGLCWITMEGDRTDYAPVPGDTLRFTGPGLLVVEGLEDDNAVEWRS